MSTCPTLLGAALQFADALGETVVIACPPRLVIPSRRRVMLTTIGSLPPLLLEPGGLGREIRKERRRNP